MTAPKRVADSDLFFGVKRTSHIKRGHTAGVTISRKYLIQGQDAAGFYPTSPSIPESGEGGKGGTDSDHDRRPEAMSEPTTTPPDQPQPTPAPLLEGSGPESRQDLLSRAQAFLTSPQIRDQDDAAKRKFLTDKGLVPAEVDSLLQGIVSLWTPIFLGRFQALIALALAGVAL